MSKLILWEFRCTKCGDAFEDLAKPDVYWSKCPKCGANARREITPVRIDRTRIAGTIGASPESINHFDRVHKQQKMKEERSKANHGDYGKMPGSD